jgi:MFS family permease
MNAALNALQSCRDALQKPLWRTALGGFLIELSLGSLYVWGNITNSVTSHLRKYEPDLTYHDTNMVFGASLGVIGLSMVAGGLLERFISSPYIALLGGYTACISMYLAGLSRSLTELVLTQGILFGVGFGVAFAAPVSCAVRWDPSRKGLITGLVTSGLGCGSFVFGFVANAIVNPHSNNVDMSGTYEGYFPPNSDVSRRVPLMYSILALIYTCLVSVGFLIMQDRGSEEAPAVGNSEYELTDLDNSLSSAGTTANPLASASGRRSPDRASSPRPDEETLPSEDDVEILFGMSVFQMEEDSTSSKMEGGVGGVMSPSAAHDHTPLPRSDSMEDSQEMQLSRSDKSRADLSADYLSTISLGELYKQPTAWHVAICMALTTSSGMYVAGTYKTFGQQFISNESFLTSVGAASSLLNMFGRLFWGIVADRFGPMNSLIMLTFLFSLLLCSYPFTMYLGLFSYGLWTCAIFLFEAGNFTLYMSIVIYLFGAKHAAANYGAVFFLYSLYNVANISLLSSLEMPYYADCMFIGIMTFVGFCLALFLKKRTFGSIEA